MAKFRIFTNDRGTHNGVPMYSALTDVEARSATAAECLKRWPVNLGGASAKAIEWPVTRAESRAWLLKHVGD